MTNYCLIPNIVADNKIGVAFFYRPVKRIHQSKPFYRHQFDYFSRTDFHISRKFLNAWFRFLGLFKLEPALSKKRKPGFHVDWYSDSPSAVLRRSSDCLFYPPSCISGKFITHFIIKFFHRPKKAEISFLNQIHKFKAASSIMPGRRNNQPQIAFNKFMPGLFIAFLNAFEQFYFFLAGKIRLISDRFKIFDQRIGFITVKTVAGFAAAVNSHFFSPKLLYLIKTANSFISPSFSKNRNRTDILNLIEHFVKFYKKKRSRVWEQEYQFGFKLFVSPEEIKLCSQLLLTSLRILI